METKVYIPQNVHRTIRASVTDENGNEVLVKKMVPLFNFAPAAQFGALVPILDDTDNALFLARITPKIRAALEEFTEHDYLLAVGDPTLIAICAGILLRRFKTLKMLKWDKRTSLYISLEISP